MSWQTMLLWAWIILTLTVLLAVTSLLSGCTVNACSIKAGTTNAPIVCDKRS